MSNLPLPWIIDPKTKEPSVSLTLMVVSFVTVLVAGILQITGKTENTSIMLEMFYANVGLYFGRRLTVGGKSYGADDQNNNNQTKGQ